MGLKERRKKIVAAIQDLVGRYPAHKVRDELLRIEMAVEDELSKMNHSTGRARDAEEVFERIAEKTDLLT